MIDDLLRKYPVISDQVDPRELRVILRELQAVLDANVPGDIVEFGCYQGTTSLFIQRMLRLRNEARQLHVYDSFQGLPQKAAQDQSPAGVQFVTGELRATKAQFITNFRKAGLPLPVIHTGWFDELNAERDVPPRIALAFLDGDYYHSIQTSLRLIWPRLVPGATVLVDDFQSESLPGAAKAVHEWLRGHHATFHAEASLAVIHHVENA